jgi:hypothetical protein
MYTAAKAAAPGCRWITGAGGHLGILRPKHQPHRLGALEPVWYLEYALSSRPAYFDRIGFHPYQWDQQTTAAGCLNLTHNWGGRGRWAPYHTILYTRL